MARPWIEFIFAQNQPWQASQAGDIWPGTEAKLLSADPETGERTLLVRFPAGFDATPAADFDIELFVLDGALDIAGTRHGPHGYAYLPRWADARIAAAAEEAGQAVALVWLHRPGFGLNQPSPDFPREAQLMLGLDTAAMPWDSQNKDPKLGHLLMARKNLRLDPRGSCRTWLLGGMPHSVPPDGKMAMETHPHAEEMFLIAGSMSSCFGLMRPGAYFYRPAGILHGLNASLSGFLVIMRQPGSNVIQTDWTEDRKQIDFNTPFTPHLPDDLPAGQGADWRYDTPY